MLKLFIFNIAIKDSDKKNTNFYSLFNVPQKDFTKALAHLKTSRPVHLRNLHQNKTYIFIFTLLCGASKGFMKTINPFEAPQKSVRQKV